MAENLVHEALVNFHGGNGFIVTSDGIIFTCFHVIEGYPDYNKIPCTISGEKYYAKIITKWEILDFVILQLHQIEKHPKKFLSVPIKIEPSINPTNKFGIFYYNDNDEIDYETGTDLFPYYFLEKGINYLKLKCDVFSGMSGSPIWDFQTKGVIGIVIEQDLREIDDATRRKADAIKTKIFCIGIPMSSIIESIFKSETGIPHSLISIIEKAKREVERVKKLMENLFQAFIKNNITYVLDAKIIQPFRPEGPQIIDFEKGDWVYVPKIADKIFKDLQEGKTLIMKGRPATGKTVISRYVGFKSIKEINNKVYYFDFLNLFESDIKAILQKLDTFISNLEFENLEKSKNNPLFIFENIHAPRLNEFQLMERLFLPSLKVFKEKVKILITTRGSLTPFPWIEKDSIINLDEMYDLNEEIIEGLISKYNQKRLASGLKKVKWIAQDIPENLWILGWYLRVLYTLENSDSTSLDLNKITRKLKDQIETYYLVYFPEFPQTYKIITVLLIISVFSKFETPVEEDFILNYTLREFEGLNLENTQQIIKQLVEKKEIISNKIEHQTDISVEKFEYRIPHIKLAEILQENFFTKVNREKFSNIFKKYIQKGKNVDILRNNLWIQKEFPLALECFQLKKTENDVVEELLKSYSFGIKTSNNHVSELDLSYNKISKLPKTLSTFSKLTSLNLSNNEISKIEKFEKLESLQVLNLGYNLIENLPSSIENLIKLRELDLKGNPIKNFPESLKNLTFLRKIFIPINRQLHKSIKVRFLFTNLKSKGVYIGTWDLDEQDALTFKVFFAGDKEKDKLNVINLHNSSIDYKLTIGVNIFTNRKVISNCKISIILLDFSSERRFLFVREAYLKGANYLVYLTKFENGKKIEGFKDWVRIYHKGNPEGQIFLIINDKDKPTDLILTDEQLEFLCDDLNVLTYVKLSTVEVDFITLLFDEIHKSIIW